MPPVIAAAAITSAAVIGSAAIGSHAADKAANTVAQGNDAAIQLQREQDAQQRADFAPWRAVGVGALQMLGRTMGVQVPANIFPTDVAPVPQWSQPAAGAGATTPTVATQPGATPVATAPQLVTPGQSAEAAYLAANPGIAEEYQQEATRDKKSKAYLQKLGINSAEDYARWHYQTMGQAEGRQWPTATAPVYAPATPAASVTQGGSALPPPTAQDYNGSPLGANGVANTGLTAGTNARYGDFYASPDYQFRLDEGNRAITGNKAAKGLLDSGALGKGLINYGQAAASQEFGSWYNRIAALAGVGQTATAQTTAGTAAATNAQMGLMTDTAQTRASSIATRGGITSGLINGAANIGAGLIQNYQPGAPTVQAANIQTNVPGLIPTNVGGGAPIYSGSLFGPPI